LPVFACFSRFLAPFPLHGVLNFLKISLIFGYFGASEGGVDPWYSGLGGLLGAFRG